MVPKPNVQTQKVVLHYEALPGVETVHSTLTVRAVHDLFIDNKIRLKCLATLLSMYSRSQEVELQEHPTQLALVMVPTDTNTKGNVVVTDRLCCYKNCIWKKQFYGLVKVLNLNILKYCIVEFLK